MFKVAASVVRDQNFRVQAQGAIYEALGGGYF